LSRSATLFNYDAKLTKLADLETQMGAMDFWDNPDKAKETVARLKLAKAQTEPLKAVIGLYEDATVAYEMAKEDGDKDLLVEADESLFLLRSMMERVELQSLLSGKHDHRNCFLTLSAGDGGTEANDWAEMLFRMYLYYTERMGFKVEELAKTYGTEVGVDSVTLHIQGAYAFGNLACEHGTHRLARVSPFNAQGKRQTSFATVDVTPEFEESKLEIPEKDLEFTFFARSSGPGGQNVNKVASACRIVHTPTGFMVVASTHREQSQNRRQAMTLLQAKLEQLAEEKRAAELKEAKGGDLSRGWGTQIRSYVFYDNRVKDHRTGHEETNYEKVLQGQIEPFIDAELKRRRSEKEAKV
jgi:peptide chain release factor 2